MVVVMTMTTMMLLLMQCLVVAKPGPPPRRSARQRRPAASIPRKRWKRRCEPYRRGRGRNRHGLLAAIQPLLRSKSTRAVLALGKAVTRRLVRKLAWTSMA